MEKVVGSLPFALRDKERGDLWHPGHSRGLLLKGSTPLYETQAWSVDPGLCSPFLSLLLEKLP